MAKSPASAAAPLSYTGVFSFGDSLVDPSNDLKAAEKLGSFPFVNVPDGAPTAANGYFLGRFTDGYNFADLVANKLLGTATQATFPYGVAGSLLGIPINGARPDGDNLSFAYGGATVGSAGSPAPSLHDQVQIYKDFDVHTNGLYLVSIGANDVLHLVPTGGTPVTGAAADQQLQAIASGIAQEVQALISRGVQHVVVANAPDVSVTPAYTGAADEAARRSLLAQYVHTVNADLQADLNGIALPAGSTILDYNFQAYTDAVVANPAAYGFSNVTDALKVVQPVNPDGTGGGYLFFDKLHPTAQAHAQIASEILYQLANPGGAAHDWTAAPAIGAQAASTIGLHGASDFLVSLAAGQTYVVDALGVSTASGTLSDPTVRVLDASGAVVAEGDDGGIGLNTHLQFTVSATTNYTIEVGGVGVTAGSFKLQVEGPSGTNLLTSGLLQGSDISVPGDAGNNTLVALSGTNVLFGADGNDSITGGTGFDRVNGNKGDDVILGHSLTGDWLLGGQGNDVVNAFQSTGHNILNGNLGADTLFGGVGGDTLRGGQGDDTITGGASGDWLSGDLGDNTLTGGGGADTFHAGGGIDHVADFSLAQGDRVQLDAGETYTANQVGADTVINLSGGGQMVLANVQLNTLTDGWIFNA
ncbi:SGNH/GDSL hydrolase family protein [Phenylobacterium sp.]|uniref:SGNH/GDSL hydrolase family protein n=1 Tax=Phenylobacterium sp. TaxID=1871053 RepID=UPI002B4A5E94|nr:SGNH/GDSL hydrolase family protein [Phenylobacterium sp.]